MERYFMLKRVICLMLVIVLCMAMACPVFAAHNTHHKESPEHVTNCGPGHHKYNHHGVCVVCGAVKKVCHHNYNAFGACKYCGAWRDNPKTGDNIMAWAGTMLLSVSALISVAVIYRKKFA